MINMKITMETVYQGTTAPVCTVVKSSGQERLLKPTVKNVSVVRVSGTAKTSRVPGHVKSMEMDITRPLTLNGIALVDTASTHL